MRGGERRNMNRMKRIFLGMVVLMTLLPPFMTGKVSAAGTLLTPTMTGYTTPSGKVENSGTVYPGYDTWHLFDGQQTSNWMNYGSTAWVQYDFPNPVVVTNYSLVSKSQSYTAGEDPNNWQLLGSNDGTSWTTIDTRTGQTFGSAGMTKSYTTTNTVAYSYIRLNITLTPNYGYTALSKLNLYGTASSATTVPTGLSASAGDKQVSLSWNANTDANFKNYNLYRNGTLISSPTSATSYLDSGLVDGTTYSYTISATDKSGTETAQSSAVTATPVFASMATPTGLVATPGNTQVSLSWSAITDSRLAGYRIYQNGTYLVTVNKPATTYTVTGLTNGTSYSYQISWVDSATPFDESSKSTAVTGIPAKPPDTTAPTIPTGVTASDAGSQTASITWNASTDPDDAVAGYNLYQNGVLVNKSGLITGTSANVTSLVKGQTYSYTVTAVDTAGNESAKSPAASVTISDNLTVSLVPNMDSIVVQISGGIPPYSVNWGSGSGSFSSTSYTITGLTANTDYTVSIADTSGKTYSKTVNTGNMQAFVPPVMPDPVSMFQKMIDSFGTAGTIAIAVIGAAIGLGALVILGMYGWRLAKKWLAASK